MGLFMQGIAATTAERHAAGQLHSTIMRERAARTPDKIVSRRFTMTILDSSSRSEGVTTIRVDDSYTGDPIITRLLACDCIRAEGDYTNNARERKIRRLTLRVVPVAVLSIMQSASSGGKTSVAPNVRRKMCGTFWSRSQRRLKFSYSEATTMRRSRGSSPLTRTEAGAAHTIFTGSRPVSKIYDG